MKKAHLIRQICCLMMACTGILGLSPATATTTENPETTVTENKKTEGTNGEHFDLFTNCTTIPNSISGFLYMGEYNNSKYFCSSTNNFTWDEAMAAVAAAGGHLAVINSSGENDFIKNGLVASEAWIGYTDEMSEGNWKWVNNDPSSYTNWDSGEPNNINNSDYAVMMKSSGKWRDREGHDEYEFVMEIPCPTTPPPPVSCSGTPDLLVKWNLNACGSPFNSYSEFTPTYPNNGGCSAVTATNVSRNSGDHSCVAGAENSTAGMCVGGINGCSFANNSSKAVRFEVTITPNAGGTGQLAQLQFYQKSPYYFLQLNGNSGINNYYTKFGIRVTKNGQEVFKQTGLNTKQNWTLENIDFSSDPDFTVTSTTTFKFELLGYCPVGNSSNFSAWDLDEIKIFGCCSTPNPCQGTITSFKLFDLNTNQPVTGANPLQNGATYFLSQLPASFNLEAMVNGTLGSVKFQVNNASATENQSPYNFPATGSAWNPAPGTYNIIAKGYSGTNGGGTLCDEKSITIIIQQAPPCNITASVANIQCNDNNTPSNPGDDKFTFSLTVTGNNTGNGWNAMVGGQSVSGNYGVAKNLGPYPISGGPLNFDVKDNANSNCKTNVIVNPPAPCSNTPAPATYGNFVFIDVNQNGIQEFGEPGFPGITVKLYKCDGTFVAETTTGNDGIYSFTGLASNMEYYAEFSGLPAGFQFTIPNAGADNVDSDANPANGRTDCTFLTPGEIDDTWDAGIFQTPPQNGSIGDFVWNDLNKNGIQDTGEPGVPGVTVRLKNCSNAVLSVTTTGTNGGYLFNNLPAGCYRIGVDLPAGFIFSPQGQGGDNTKDSDINPATAMTGDVNLAQGQNNLTVDAGINEIPPQNGSIGDFVWNDLNKNGIQDPGEPGVPGVTVRLKNCSNAVLSVLTTGTNGGYLFNNLPAGCYRIGVDLPAGFTFSPQGQGGDNTKDSDINPATAMTGDINLAQGQNNVTVDAGINETPQAGPGKIGDFVWFDANGNGIQDTGEPGIPNVFVILETCTGTFTDFAVTNGNGMYMFNNVQPGQYRIKYANPGTFNGVSLQLTLQNAGNDDTKDSDADWLGFTDCFTLAPGETNLTLDAGFTGEIPPPVCNINGSVTNKVCNNNGTPNNPADDTYTFTLVVNGSNTGAWGYDIPSLNLFMQAYGQPVNLGPFQISNGTLNLNIVDHDIPNCTTIVSVTPPQTCSAGTPCTATAGTLVATQNPVTLQNGSAAISATQGQQPFIPAGFQKIYVLTKGAGLVIQGVNNTPNFTVTSTGLFTIHTLVYNPATLNLGIVVPGVTTGFDVNSLLIQGGGTICGALDVTGAPITVNPPVTTVLTLTCPANINITSQAGQNGAIVNYPAPTASSTCNAGSVNITTNPASGSFFPVGTTSVNVTATDGCGNTKTCNFTVTVNPGGGAPNCDDISIGTSTGTITIGGLTAPIVMIQIFNTSTWQTVFSCSGNCNTPTQVISNLPSGSYYVKVTFLTAAWQQICLKEKTVTVGGGGTNLTLNCPANISVTAPAGQNGMVVNYPAPTANSTCTNGSVSVNTNPASGSFFPIGTTTVNVTAADGCGNTKTCSFTVTVIPGGGGCDNVTNGGTIGFDETNCTPYDPANIQSLTLPSGGSGQIEYIWLVSTLGCPDNINQGIPGTNSPSYNPPPISQTTWYLRCSRRVGCTQWIESNCIKKEVCNPTGGGCNIAFTAGPGSISISGLNAPNVDVKVFNAAWQTVYSCFNNCNNPQVVTGLTPGSYYVTVQTWNAAWSPLCNKDGYVTVSSQLVAPEAPTNEAITPAQKDTKVGFTNDVEVLPLNFGTTGNAVLIFPNPANNNVTVAWADAGQGKTTEIFIYNQLGQAVNTFRLEDGAVGKQEIDLSYFRAGQYMVALRIAGEAPVIRKLVISR